MEQVVWGWYVKVAIEHVKQDTTNLYKLLIHPRNAHRTHAIRPMKGTHLVQLSQTVGALFQWVVDGF